MNKMMRRALAVCAGVVALTAVAAPAASAATANWVQGSGGVTASITAPLVFKAKVSPTLTHSFTCNPANTYLSAAWAGTTTTPGVGTHGTLSFSIDGSPCVDPNGGLSTIVAFSNFGTALWAEKNGSVFSLRGTDSAMMYIQGPFGWYQSNNGRAQPDYTVAWTNGSVANPSRVTFNNTQIGVTSYGVPITLSGTVYITRNGGLISLS